MSYYYTYIKNLFSTHQLLHVLLQSIIVSVHFMNILRIKRCILIVLYLNNMHTFFEAILLDSFIIHNQLCCKQGYANKKCFT